MVLGDLIGKQIEDIRVKLAYESYGLDKADSFIVLSENLIVGIPWTIDNDETVWERDLDKNARTIFTNKKNERDASLKGRKIVDLLHFVDSEAGFIEAEKVVIELEDERFITEITIAPNGTGHAGLWVFHSKSELENRFGKHYKRLSDDKGSA